LFEPQSLLFSVAHQNSWKIWFYHKSWPNNCTCNHFSTSAFKQHELSFFMDFSIKSVYYSHVQEVCLQVSATPCIYVCLSWNYLQNYLQNSLKVKIMSYMLHSLLCKSLCQPQETEFWIMKESFKIIYDKLFSPFSKGAKWLSKA
jgi:hypothetical protein